MNSFKIGQFNTKYMSLLSLYYGPLTSYERKEENEEQIVRKVHQRQTDSD